MSARYCFACGHSLPTHELGCPEVPSRKTVTRVSDPINPAHYKGDAVAVFCEQFELTAWEAQVIKYTARNKQKNGIEDLKKALWYLEREIKIRSAKQGIPGGP